MTFTTKMGIFLNDFFTRKALKEVESEAQEKILDHVIDKMIPNAIDMIELKDLEKKIKVKFANIKNEKLNELVENLNKSSRLIVQRRGNKTFYTRGYAVNTAELEKINDENNNINVDSQEGLEAILDQIINEGMIIKGLPVKLVDLVNLIRVRYNLVGEGSDKPLKKIIEYIKNSGRTKLTESFGIELIEQDVNDNQESNFWSK